MRLSLGSVQFGLNYGVSNNGGIVKFNEVKKIIDFAKKNNVNFIDTAPAYGESQKKLGKINLDKFKIISKLPKLPKNIKKNKIEFWIESQLKSSLKELNIKKFYSVLFHNSDDLLKKNGSIIFKKLNELKKKNFLLKIGVAVYTKIELKKILKRFRIDLVNFPFSIGNTQFADQKLISEIKRKKLEIHTRSIFMQGLLLIKDKSKIPKKLNKSKFLENWQIFLKKNKIQALEGCIQFVKSRKEFDVITIGVENLKQFKQIIKIFNEKKIIKFPKKFNKFKYSNISKW